MFNDKYASSDVHVRFRYTRFFGKRDDLSGRNTFLKNARMSHLAKDEVLHEERSEAGDSQKSVSLFVRKSYEIFNLVSMQPSADCRNSRDTTAGKKEGYICFGFPA